MIDYPYDENILMTYPLYKWYEINKLKKLESIEKTNGYLCL